jgi:hypothetical protein
MTCKNQKTQVLDLAAAIRSKNEGGAKSRLRPWSGQFQKRACPAAQFGQKSSLDCVSVKTQF